MTILLLDKTQTTLLLIKKIIFSNIYLDYINVFLKKSAEILLKRRKINKYIIELKEDKQVSHGLIYNLDQIKFKLF